MRIQSIPQPTLAAPTATHAANPSLRAIALQRQTTHRKNSKNICRTLLIHLDDFAGHEVRIREVTESFVRRFAAYLLSRTLLKAGSVRTYLQKLHAIVEEAVRRRLLPYNPCRPSPPWCPAFQPLRGLSSPPPRYRPSPMPPAVCR